MASGCLAGCSGHNRRRNRAPKGHIPVLVGCVSDDDGGQLERFLLDVNMLKDPCIVELLDTAVREFGYHQEGVLRIPVDVHRFRCAVDICGGKL